MENIKLLLTAEELDYVNEVLTIDVEKNLCRLERNIDVSDNNIQKINTAREIQIKIIKSTEDSIEAPAEEKLGLGLELIEEDEVDLEVPVNECLDILDELFSGTDGEELADLIASEGYTLNDYCEHLYKKVINRAAEDDEFIEIDMLEKEEIKTICKEYILQYEDVADLFALD